MSELKTEELKFLRLLSSWTGAATPQEIGPQTSQAENSARQACKRKGLVTFKVGYWRLTDAGRSALRTPQEQTQDETAKTRPVSSWDY